MTRLITKLVGLLAKLSDPVCQDQGATLYGEYKGELVPLVPIVAGDGRVEKWMPDPVFVQDIDNPPASSAQSTASSAPASVPPPLNLNNIAGL